VLAILTGTIVTAVSINLLKARGARLTETTEEKAA